MDFGQNGRTLASFIFYVGILVTGIACAGGTPVSTALVPVPEAVVEPAAPLPTPTQATASGQVLPEVSVYDLDSGEPYPADGQTGYPAPADSGGLPSPIVAQSDNSLVSPQGALPTPIPTAAVAQATAAPTQEPTPTILALPQTLPDEHYWMKRPIPEGGVVWTDKEYPYGSTRGGTLRVHHGVEFYVGYDVPVLASAPGRVIVAGDDSETAYGPQTGFYGNLVIIEHDFTYQGQPVYSLYGHLNAVNVVVGQEVAMSQQVGLSGATGIADGAHLHFEVRVGENSYASTRNPLTWLWPFPDNGTLVGRIVYPNGNVAYETPVKIHRIDGGDSTVYTVLTYARGDIQSDEKWNENFAFDDVDAGLYEVEVKIGGNEFKTEVYVYPRQTAFVEIILTNR